jgi:hypothetical protein
MRNSTNNLAFVEKKHLIELFIRFSGMKQLKNRMFLPKKLSRGSGNLLLAYRPFDFAKIEEKLAQLSLERISRKVC